ncbi:MAG TPA: sugar nucleotide-binding protein [Kofleriaceae bacterium]|jgi:dTDP-4-dehydrorhamnose reductase|nr:sugar nucleotide-binding protein [Kofleriaceae bacterium]
MLAGDVFLFGATSMLGWSILRAASRPLTAFCNGHTRRPPDGIERGIHLDDALAVYELFAAERPALIVHCAGVCDVEKCEQSPEFAYSVNVDGMQLLLDHAPREARIVYCSSDHVFSGDTGPYDEGSPTDPLSVYGRTRVAAERLLAERPNSLIVRTGLWIGPSATGRNGHLDWLRYRHERCLPMTVVADELRSAMWAEDAARRVWDLAHSGVTGIRHIVATRVVSRPELAAYLARRYALDARLDVHYRRDRRAPHLGRVELATRYTDELARPLPSVIPDAAHGP